MSKKKRWVERKFVKIVHHQPTYTFIGKELVFGDPLSRRGSTPVFKSKNVLQSRKSTKRLSNAINWMLVFADRKRVYSKETKKTFSFRLGFLTLTLPDKQAHTDNYIKEHMLQPFLYWMTRYYNANYVWKAEAQLNGNIHFHLTIDTFIHWKSIRSKWNQICAKHQYCKVFQDGSNDKGDASTQIKCVLHELEVAKYLGSYVAKKSTVRKEKYGDAFKDGNIPASAYGLSCDIDEENKQDPELYLRFIDGRLWGSCEKLSKIQVTLMEGFDENFYPEERLFFRENSGIQNLGKLLYQKEMKLHRGKTESEKSVIGVDDESLKKKYSHLENVFIHRNILTMKKGPLLSGRIAEEKLKRQNNTQKYFTVDSLTS